MDAKGCPFVDRVKYQETQKTKPKKGFHTSDYSRRDEFTYTFRTEQYREQLKVGIPWSTQDLHLTRLCCIYVNKVWRLSSQCLDLRFQLSKRRVRLTGMQASKADMKIQKVVFEYDPT